MTGISILRAAQEFYSIRALLIVAQEEPANDLAPLREYKRRNDVQLGTLVRDYILAASFGEARHARGCCIKYIPIPHFNQMSRPTTMTVATQYDPASIQTVLSELFDAYWRNSSIGGQNWKNAIDSLMLYDPERPAIFIDHCLDLHHNTGTLFSKYDYRIINDCSGLGDFLQCKTELPAVDYLITYWPTTLTSTLRAIAYELTLPAEIKARLEYGAASVVDKLLEAYKPIQWGNEPVPQPRLNTSVIRQMVHHYTLPESPLSQLAHIYADEHYDELCTKLGKIPGMQSLYGGFMIDTISSMLTNAWSDTIPTDWPQLAKLGAQWMKENIPVPETEPVKDSDELTQWKALLKEAEAQPEEEDTPWITPEEETTTHDEPPPADTVIHPVYYVEPYKIIQWIQEPENNEKAKAIYHKAKLGAPYLIWPTKYTKTIWKNAAMYAYSSAPQIIYTKYTHALAEAIMHADPIPHGTKTNSAVPDLPQPKKAKGQITPTKQKRQKE